MVKTAEETIHALATGHCYLLSLDHDLELAAYGNNPKQYRGKTGYDVALWLEKNPKYWPTKGVQVHSMNPVGKARILNIVRKHYPRRTTVCVYSPLERQESHLPALQAELCFRDGLPDPPPSVIL